MILLFSHVLVMLSLIVVALIPCLSAASRQQPPGCPFPTGPYVPPECGENKYFEICSFKCPPQTCPAESDDLCDPGDGCCRNECRCIDGYFKDDDNVCIPADQCKAGSTSSQSSSVSSSSSSSSQSQTSSSSSSTNRSSQTLIESSCPLQCKPTCAKPNPITCDLNRDCNCKSGNVWTTDGRKCIPIHQCPNGPSCNGDPNAHIMEKPPACPPNCDSPDGSPFCERMQLAFGCACNCGYLFNSEGICVTPNSCPAK